MGIKEQLYPLKKMYLNLLCSVSKSGRKFLPEDNILIFSYPRSGSTWLAEMINCLPRTALLWEPLHLRNVNKFRELGFGWRQYIPETEQWKEAEETFEKLFKGRYLNYWLSSREFPLKFCTSERMIIKFVRANGMLPWLTKNFVFNNSPIFLIRHPFAVAASQMKEGSWNDKFEAFEVPDMPFNEFYHEHSSFLSSLKTKQSRIVANWCLNNQIVLQNSRNNIDWVNVCYENLLVDPEQELKRIFSAWNIPMPKVILRKISKASSTTQESTFQKSVDEQLSKWRTFFSGKEIELMQRVLNYFEIKIYSDDVMPVS